MKTLTLVTTLILIVLTQFSCLEGGDRSFDRVANQSLDDKANNASNNVRSDSNGVKITDPRQTLEFDYIGCWGGSKGGLIEITSNQIGNLHTHETFSYEVIDKTARDKGKSLLLKLTGKTQSSYLKEYFLVRPLEENRFAYYGYDSIEDNQAGHFSAAAEFFRGDCKGYTGTNGN